MSRIQNILEKAEREGAALRTGHLGAPPVGVSAMPITIDIPAPPVPPASVAEAVAYTVRLNPLLVAGLAPKSPAAEQYRALRTRIAHTEGANALRTVLITSPQKGEGKSITSANLALTMAQELQRRVVILE